MKKLLTAAGLVAVGSAGLYDAQAQTKPWSVSASLRGFYDDNFATTPSNGPIPPQDSFGVEVSPMGKINWRSDQTAASLSYQYTMRWYEARSSNSADHIHQVEGKVDHTFSPRYKASIADSFVVAQEPQLLAPTGVVVIPLRTEGDNIRNRASASFSAEITRLLGIEIGYINTFYDYEQDGPGSRSALLDRVEHLGLINLRWQALPDTVALIGYQFGYVDQTSSDSLNGPAGPFVSPDVRDNHSHYGYLGVDHYFTPQLTASARVGVQHTEYPNASSAGLSDSSTNPYADVSITYGFLQDSFVQLGARIQRTQTDVATFGTSAPTLDAETIIGYGSISHKFTPRLTGNLIGQVQHYDFEEGFAGGMNDMLYLVGVNIEFEINKFLTAETGYNYDRLDSDLGGRSFTRNRVYVGIRATY